MPDSRKSFENVERALEKAEATPTPEFNERVKNNSPVTGNTKEAYIRRGREMLAELLNEAVREGFAVNEQHKILLERAKQAADDLYKFEREELDMHK